MPGSPPAPLPHRHDTQTGLPATSINPSFGGWVHSGSRAHPPADAPAAARRLALGLTLMFALSPATRFGYFAYPVGLYGWLALCGPESFRLGRLLDRGQRHWDPAVRVLRAAGDLRLRLRSVPLFEPGDAGREELPRLG